MEFEFDPKKSKTNKEKHGLSLQDAQVLWNVPHVQLEARTTDEPRFMLIGEIKGKCYSCIYTTRGQKIRLISARRSRTSEEKIYHEHIK